MNTPCPAGCGRVQQPGKLLCLPCWREVPCHLQQDVYRTWRAYKRIDVRTAPQLLRTARIAYQEARDAAIGAVA